MAAGSSGIGAWRRFATADDTGRRVRYVDVIWLDKGRPALRGGFRSRALDPRSSGIVRMLDLAPGRRWATVARCSLLRQMGDTDEVGSATESARLHARG